MVTIKDIAKIAGVSHTTVSRALNDNPLIKMETRKRIQKIALELNYAPNFNAKSLVNQKNYTIGLFFSSIDEGTSSSFIVDVITAINSILDESYSLSVQGIDEIMHLSKINFQRYDGVIIMSQRDNDQSFIDYVSTQSIPFVVLNRQLESEDIVNIIANDAEGVSQMVDYVVSMGHRKMAYISGKNGFKSSDERKKGFCLGLKKNNISLENKLFFQGDYSIKSGYQEMVKILNLPDIPTVVFCANDDMAIGALRAASELGFNVPNDISLTGFDDSLFVSYINPPLTTVHKPIKLISQTGITLLLDLIDKKSIKQKQIRIDTCLKIRQSVTYPTKH